MLWHFTLANCLIDWLKVEAVLPMAQLEVNIGNIRLALHACVVHANSLPSKSQQLLAPSSREAGVTGEKAKAKVSRGKRVSVGVIMNGADMAVCVEVVICYLGVIDSCWVPENSWAECKFCNPFKM